MLCLLIWSLGVLFASIAIDIENYESILVERSEVQVSPVDYDNNPFCI